MGDCGPSGCSDRQVLVQPPVFHFEMPQRSSCTPGGGCSPRIERMQTLQVPPPQFGSFCDAGGCRTGDTRAAVLQPFDRNQHESNVRNNFDFTDKDYSKALAKAAREGKPLVVVFASERTPGTMNTSESVKSAQNSSVGSEGWPVKGNAVFVYVDTNRAANNPELSDLMKQKGIGADKARTIIYNAELGTDGRVKPVATALNNDRSDFSGAQLAADIHSAKAHSRPINVGESLNQSERKPQEATPAPSDRTDHKRDHTLDLEAKLAKQALELERMQAQLNRMKPIFDELEAEKERQKASGGVKLMSDTPPSQPKRPIDDSVKPLVPKTPSLRPVPAEVAPKPVINDGKIVDPAAKKPDVKPETPVAPKGAKVPTGIDLLKPDPPVVAREADHPNQFENQRNQIQANFNNFMESEDRRLNGAIATVKDDHPTATKETTKWLREQEDMNLLADRDIRNKLDNLGTYLRGKNRRADEDANVQKRSEQWQDLRFQAANPTDPNHKAKQYMLYEFMTGLHTDGANFGRDNDERINLGGQALKTDREQMQVQAAEALTNVLSTPGVKHELATRLIADGLTNLKVPVAARVKLLDAIEPIAKDTANQYLDGHAPATAVSMVVRAILKSHNEKESNGDFQRAAMDKLVKMNAVEAYGVIEYLSRESGSDKTRQHARDHIARLTAKPGK